jgi:hypothetical protein
VTGAHVVPQERLVVHHVQGAARPRRLGRADL